MSVRGMKRREFIAALGGSAAWPVVARAEESALPVVGFLDWGSQNNRVIAAFRRGLAEAGYVDGQNVKVEFRWAEGRYDLLQALAADLVRRQLVAIVASGSTGTALAVRAVNSTIPVIVVAGGDPVKFGLASSWSRPDRNVTGVTFVSTELAGKRLSLLNQVAPQIKSVAYLSGGPLSRRFENEASGVAEAANALGWQLVTAEAKSTDELDEAFAKIGRSQAESLVVGVVPHFTYNSGRIVELARQSKIPTIYPFRVYVERGGLMSYAADYLIALRKVSTDYVGRILKGAKVADLPIQRPDKFELVFNRKAAKELNLDIPPTLLALADEVVE
jgi:putative tryptophan/tyrosine transport system substrate-binding protein